MFTSLHTLQYNFKSSNCFLAFSICTIFSEIFHVIVAKDISLKDSELYLCIYSQKVYLYSLGNEWIVLHICISNSKVFWYTGKWSYCEFIYLVYQSKKFGSNHKNSERRGHWHGCCCSYSNYHLHSGWGFGSSD